MRKIAMILATAFAFAVCLSAQSAKASLITEFSQTPSLTQEEPLTLPYYQNFESTGQIAEWTFQNGSNAWVIGYSVNNTFTEDGVLTQGGAMYISSDNGTSNSYGSETTTSFAYTLVEFGQNASYGLSFDYQVMGEQGSDYGRVYLLPSSAEVSEANLNSQGIALTDRLQGKDSWNRAAIVIPASCAGGEYNLVFVWKNNSYNEFAPAFAVDNLKLAEINCDAVSNFEVACEQDGSLATASLMIENSSDDANYWVEYRVKGNSDWLGYTSAPPVQIEDLLLSTVYEMRVTAICNGEDTSLVSPIHTFTTPCGAISQIPHSEGFEDFFPASEQLGNRTAPLCWVNINGGASGFYFEKESQAANAASGTGALRYRGLTSASTNEVISDWMISPLFELTGNEQVTFKLRNREYNHYYPFVQIDVVALWAGSGDMESSADTSMFTLIETLNHTSTSAAYKEYTVGLSGYIGQTRVAFVVRTPVQSFVIDDVTVSSMPECPDVYRVKAGALSATSAGVSFSTSNSIQGGWEVAYGQASSASEFDPATALSEIIPSDAQLPYPINNLTAGQTYYFAVKQNCDGGAWSEVVSTRLPLSVGTLPLDEDFSNPASVTGWEFAAQESEPAQSWVIGSAVNNPNSSESAGETQGALYVSTDGGTNNDYTVSSSSIIDAYTCINFPTAAGFSLSFDWKAVGEGTSDFLKAYLIPLEENFSEQYAITGVLSESATWQTVNIEFPASYANRAYKLLFRWENDSYAGSTPAASVDNVRISALSCATLSELNARFVDATSQDAAPSIEVSIVDNNSNVGYVLEYKKQSETQWTHINDLTAASFPYTIPAVDYSTVYDVRVAVLCPDGNLTAFTETQVTIPCGATPAPWQESFDVSPLTSSCWEKRSGILPETQYIEISELAPMQYGGWSYRPDGRMRMDMSDYSNPIGWLITPSVRLTAGTTYEISFDASLNDIEPEMAEFLPSSSEVGDRFAVIVSFDNGDTWSATNGLVFDNEDANTELNYSSLTSTAQRFSFEVTQPVDRTIRLAFYAESEASEGWHFIHIDNIEVSERAECTTPANIAVSDITATTAIVRFTNAEQVTQWEYSLALASADETATPVTSTFTSEDSSLVLQNLIPQTAYTIALRKICDEGFASSWSAPVEFTTLSIPTTLPFTTDFEGSEDNALWSTKSDATSNRWVIGPATFAGDSEDGTSAYISNDDQSSYAASRDGLGSSVYIYRDFDFGSDPTAIYTLSFDWKTSGLDFSGWVLGGLEVYLADPSALSETTNPSESQRVALLYGQNTWTSHSMEITGVTGVKRLAFHSFGYTETEELVAPSAIDNVEILPSSCPSPQNITVNNITSSVAEVAWQGSALSYEVSYRSSIETEYTILTTTLPNITLSNLNPSTIYYLTVKAICDGEQSASSPEVTFQTVCPVSAIVSFPYLESYEVGLNCWTVEQIAGNEDWEQKNELQNGEGQWIEAADGAGTYFAGVRLPEATTVTRLISPVFDLSGVENPYLSFLRLSLSYTMWGADQADIDQMKVYYRSAETDTWSQLLHYTDAAESWQFDSVALANPSATYQIAFEVVGNGGNGVGLDNVKVYNAVEIAPEPPCGEPADLTAVNITETSADIIWSGTADNYAIRLNGGTEYTTAETTYSFTDLTPATDYTVEVKAVCENGDSEWVSHSFQTLAEIVEVVVGEVVTEDATNITATSATLHGNIVSRGNSTDYVVGFEIAATESELGNGLTLPATEEGDSFSGELSDMPAGTYYYRAFLLNEAGFAYGEAKTITLSSSLSEVENAIRFALYPNPASERVTLNLDGLNVNAQIVVSDAQGRILYSDTMNAGIKTYELNTQNYKSGLYYVRIISTEGVSTQKLIVR